MYKKIGQIGLFCIFLFVAGCGTQPTLDPKQTIESNYEIDSVKSLDVLKREYANRFVDSYPSEDNQMIFIQVKSEYSGFSLLQCDISKPEPRLIHILVDQNSGLIKAVTLLPEKKLIYVLSDYKGMDRYVEIYDYKVQKKLKEFEVPENGELVISADRLSFQKGTAYYDISNIYSDSTSWVAEQKKANRPPSTLFRNDIDQVVIDPVNRLVWQDDDIALQKHEGADDILTSMQMIAVFSVISQAADKYNWRLPSEFEVKSLFDTYGSMIEDKFQNIADGWYLTNEGLKDLDDTTKSGFIWIGYDMKYRNFSQKNYTEPHYYRLVADYNGTLTQ